MLCKSVKATSDIPPFTSSLIPSVISTCSVTIDDAGAGGGGVLVTPQLISPAKPGTAKIQTSAIAAQSWRKYFMVYLLYNWWVIALLAKNFASSGN
jgi:hypothetical protein